jgi:hypothetical protein
MSLLFVRRVPRHPVVFRPRLLSVYFLAPGRCDATASAEERASSYRVVSECPSCHSCTPWYFFIAFVARESEGPLPRWSRLGIAVVSPSDGDVDFDLDVEFDLPLPQI